MKSTQEPPLSILEFGNEFMVSTELVDLDPVKRIVLEDKERMGKVLSYFKNVKYLEEKPFVEAIDKLQRFNKYGWYIRAEIQGYDEVREHFRCRRVHEPDYIDWKYVKEIVKRWWVDRKIKDEEE